MTTKDKNGASPDRIIVEVPSPNNETYFKYQENSIYSIE